MHRSTPRPSPSSTALTVEVRYTVRVPPPSPSDPRVGDRVEAVGPCMPGGRDRPGTVVEVRDGRFGRSYRVELDDGGEEWAHTVAPRGACGVGWRYL
jgi:hypothetical protein